jgi:hypothetical protein
MAGPEKIDLSGATWSGPATQEATKREVDIRRGQAGAAVSEATVKAQITKAEADARKAIADAAKAEKDAQEGPKQTATEIALEAKRSGIEQRAAVVRAQMLNNIGLYKRDIKGQPASRLFGYAEYFDKPTLGGVVPAIPAFESFTKANDTMLSLIRPLVAQSAKEGDSDKEMAVFMSYIPQAGDSDRTIETKYAMLDLLISGMAGGTSPSELLKLGMKPRGINEVEADLLQRIDPTKTQGYRLPEETAGRIRALYQSGELTPQAYADLVTAGAVQSGVQPDDAFKADALAKGRETVQNMEKGLQWGGFSYEQIDEAARGGLTWPEAALSGVANLPMSAVKSFAETGKALTVDLPETVTSIGKLAGDALGITDGETLAALGNHYATQYGTENGFLTALAERPFEVLSDATVVAGALGKAGNIAKATKLSETLDPVRLTARVASAPFKALALTGKAIQEGSAQAVGLTTGAGADALKEAAKAGRMGGEGAKTFLENMRGGADLDTVLTQAKEAVGNIRSQASEAYRSGMVDVKKDKTILDFQPIYDRLDKLRDRAFRGNKVVNPSAAAVYEKAKAIVDDWYGDTPDQFHTPEGMDALKQRLGELSNAFATENNRRASSIASGVYGEVKKVINDQVPAYAKVMADYEFGMEKLRDIEGTLSLKPGAQVDTSLRKLQSMLRNNANTNYGRRVELGRELEAAGATELFPALAGQQLSAKTPRGLGQISAGGSLMAAIPTSGASLVTLPLTSPRLMGEAAYKAGQGMGAVDRTIGAAFSNMAQRGQPIADAFDYLNTKYGDNRMTIQSLMAGAQGLQAAQGQEEVAAPQELPQIYRTPQASMPGSPVVELTRGDGVPLEDMVPVNSPAPQGGSIDLGTEGAYDADTDTYVLPDGTRVDQAGNVVELARGGSVQQLKKGGRPRRGYDYANAARTVGQGLTFGFGDEIEAKLRSLASRDPNAYENEVTRLRMLQERYAKANPNTAMVLEGAGMLGGSLLAPSLAGARVVGNAGRLARLGAGAVDALGQGALYSAGQAKPDPKVAGSDRMSAIRADAPRNAADFAILMGAGAAGKRLANTRRGQAAINFAARPVRYAVKQMRR